MQIIKRGIAPKEYCYKYIFKCNKCKTVFEVEETELEVWGNPDLEIIDKYYICPICKKRIWKSIFTKKIKYFNKEE